MTTEKQELVTKDLVWVKGGFRVSQIHAEAARLVGEEALFRAPSVFGECWPILDGFWRHLDSAHFDQFDATYRVWKDQPNLAAAAAGQAFMAAGKALPAPRLLSLVFEALSAASTVWEANRTVLHGTEEIRLRTVTSMLYATYELQGAKFLDQFYFLHLFSRFDPRQPHSGEIRLGPLAVPTDLTYAGR